jgi:hypothetical protein
MRTSTRHGCALRWRSTGSAAALAERGPARRAHPGALRAGRHEPPLQCRRRFRATRSRDEPMVAPASLLRAVKPCYAPQQVN